MTQVRRKRSFLWQVASLCLDSVFRFTSITLSELPFRLKKKSESTVWKKWWTGNISIILVLVKLVALWCGHLRQWRLNWDSPAQKDAQSCREVMWEASSFNHSTGCRVSPMRWSGNQQQQRWADWKLSTQWGTCSRSSAADYLGNHINHLYPRNHLGNSRILSMNPHAHQQRSVLWFHSADSSCSFMYDFSKSETVSINCSYTNGVEDRHRGRF